MPQERTRLPQYRSVLKIDYGSVMHLCHHCLGCLGNHAQALALAAAKASNERGFRIPTYIVLPHDCSWSKVASTRGYDAEVVFSGRTFNERRDMAQEIHRAKGVVNIPSSDDADIRLGQGTVALEFLEQMKEMGEGDLSSIIVPCGGGGLLAGVGVACAGTGVKVFGSEPQDGGADEVVRGLKRGRRIEIVDSLTIADGLRGVVGPGNWDVISRQDYVAGVYAVSDDEIKRAMALVLEELKVFIEASSAVPLAVVLYNEEFRTLMAREGGEVRIGIVLTGGNISLDSLVAMFRP